MPMACCLLVKKKGGGRCLCCLIVEGSLEGNIRLWHLFFFFLVTRVITEAQCLYDSTTPGAHLLFFSLHRQWRQNRRGRGEGKTCSIAPLLSKLQLSSPSHVVTRSLCRVLCARWEVSHLLPSRVSQLWIFFFFFQGGKKWVERERDFSMHSPLVTYFSKQNESYAIHSKGKKLQWRVWGPIIRKAESAGLGGALGLQICAWRFSSQVSVEWAEWHSGPDVPNWCFHSSREML